MVHKESFGLPLAFVLAFICGAAVAQSPVYHPTDQDPSAGIPAYHPIDKDRIAGSPVSRLAGNWHSGPAAPIPGNLPPALVAGADLGAAPSSTPLGRMLLLLSPSPVQQQALTAELANQQNFSSPEYHHWLTSAAFAAAYSNSAEDIAAVAAWLASQGFQVAPLPAGRGWIEFSGTAAEVEQAFHTEVHLVAAAEGTRAVLASGISVPGALKPLVHGLVSLDGAFASPALTTPQALAVSAAKLAAETSSSHAEALTPQLVAQLLHLDALHLAGVKGSGQIIAIPARSNVNRADVAAFRLAFGLPASQLTVNVNGSDPGLAGDQAEATLAASWAGAAAPGAQIVLVPAGSTSATDGLDLALAAIVDHTLAYTIPVGYSACEASLSETHQAFYAALYRQAAAEGIAVIAAAGDSGAAACHSAGSDARVSSGYGVSALASTPWNTAVGVAGFGSGGPVEGASALTAWSPTDVTDPAYAGGGGGSTIYGTPAWQATSSNDLAKTAVSAELSAAGLSPNRRLLPDLALPTAIDSDVNPGLAFCLSGTTMGSTDSGGCTLVRAGGSTGSSAIFAGIAALVAQKYGAQGNVAPNLYALSGQSGVFDDVQQGSAQLWCVAGSPDCGATGQIGFTAGAGYDLATGLGAVNAQTLVNQWASTEATGTGAVTVTLSVSPTEPNSTYNPSATVTLTASVVSLNGNGTPTGSVTFFDTSTGTALSSTPSPLDANGDATLTVEGVFALGGNEIVAKYSGDSTYEAFTSTPPVNVNTQLSTTSLAVVPSTYAPAPGATITVTATLTVGSPVAGSASPTGAVTLHLDGLPTASAKLALVNGVPTASFSIVIPASSTLATHALQAVYAGDGNYSASTSPQIIVTVAKGATVTTLTATPATLTVGVAETLTATLAPLSTTAGATYTITGTVNFYDGSTLLGTGIVTANAATITVSLANNTNHVITAVYSGDSNWLTSSSTALLLAATTLPDTVVLTANVSTASPGEVVVLTATVTPNSLPASTIEQNPTGNVAFYDGTTLLGVVALSASPLSDASTASLTLSTLPGGQDTLVAVYQGDLYFSAATSNLLTLDVQDFTITPSPTNPPTNLTIVKGAAGSASFIVTGLGGFNNQIQVVCAVPSQDDMTCTATPQQVTPTATVTFVVQTFAQGNTAAAASHNRPALWGRAAGGAALAVLAGFFVLPFGRRARIFARSSTRRFFILLLLLVGLGGVGIGCNSVNLVSSSGTPLGVATLKITATAYVDNAVVSHSVYLTVNVIAPGSKN
jgi:hypothetical protein